MLSERKLPRLLADIANFDPVSNVRFAKKWPDLADDLNGLRALVRRAWAGTEDAAEDVERVLFSKGHKSRMRVDWRRQTLSYQPQTTVEQALYYLLQHSSLAKICGNTECTRPLFLAKRPNERYCSDACFDQAQRLSTAKWWREHGTEWRESRRRSKEGKVTEFGARSKGRKSRGER